MREVMRRPKGTLARPKYVRARGGARAAPDGQRGVKARGGDSGDVDWRSGGGGAARVGRVQQEQVGQGEVAGYEAAHVGSRASPRRSRRPREATTWTTPGPSARTGRPDHDRAVGAGLDAALDDAPVARLDAEGLGPSGWPGRPDGTGWPRPACRGTRRWRRPRGSRAGSSGSSESAAVHRSQPPRAPDHATTPALIARSSAAAADHQAHARAAGRDAHGRLQRLAGQVERARRRGPQRRERQHVRRAEPDRDRTDRACPCRAGWRARPG